MNKLGIRLKMYLYYMNIYCIYENLGIGSFK